jgi:cytochrome P450
MNCQFPSWYHIVILIRYPRCGVGFNSVMLPYGDRWRLHRRFFHQTFRIDAIRRLLPFQHRRSCQLLRRLLDAPEQFPDHVFEYVIKVNLGAVVRLNMGIRYTGSVILNSVYDYDPQLQSDELLGMAAKVLEIVVPAVTPQVAIVVAALPACGRSTTFHSYTAF